LASCIIIVVQAEEVPMPERISEAERSEVVMVFIGMFLVLRGMRVEHRVSES
jgi:hypothetical protein